MPVEQGQGCTGMRSGWGSRGQGDEETGGMERKGDKVTGRPDDGLRLGGRQRINECRPRIRARIGTRINEYWSSMACGFGPGWRGCPERQGIDESLAVFGAACCSSGSTLKTEVFLPRLLEVYGLGFTLACLCAASWFYAGEPEGAAGRSPPEEKMSGAAGQQTTGCLPLQQRQQHPQSLRVLGQQDHQLLAGPDQVGRLVGPGCGGAADAG